MALLRSLKQHQAFKVALDVWEEEPAINTELLAQVDIGTPHIAGHSLEGKQRGSVQVYQALSQYLNVTFDNLSVCVDSPKKTLTLNKESNLTAQRNEMLLAA